LLFTQRELEESDITLYFTLFDQEKRTEKISRMREITYYENRFLGSFSIPLTTVLSTSKFEGNIKVNRPIVLPNY